MSIFHARKPFLRVAAGLALSGGLLAAAAVPANAAGVVNSAAVLATADDYLGTPYRFGGTTPAGFDCSGYTQHVFAQNGVSSAKPGDLVFFVRNGRAYHVGIYTGDGQMMDSPRSGKTVTERSIWGSNVVYGRF